MLANGKRYIHFIRYVVLPHPSVQILLLWHLVMSVAGSNFVMENIHWDSIIQSEKYIFQYCRSAYVVLVKYMEVFL